LRDVAEHRSVIAMDEVRQIRADFAAEAMHRVAFEAGCGFGEIDFSPAGPRAAVEFLGQRVCDWLTESSLGINPGQEHAMEWKRTVSLGPINAVPELKCIRFLQRSGGDTFVALESVPIWITDLCRENEGAWNLAPETHKFRLKLVVESRTRLN